MKQLTTTLFTAGLLMAALTLVGCSGNSQEGEVLATSEEGRAGTKPAVDTSDLVAAPAWELMDLDGEIVKSSDFAGRVMILDFWATWCGPCKMEIPHFIELQEQYGDDLAIVSVSVDKQGVAVVKPFVERTGINYVSLVMNSKIVNDYAPIRSIPTTFVVSQDGKIFKRYVGYKPKQVFERDIQTLLGPQES